MAGPRMTAERAYELARAGVTPEQIGDVDIREQVYSVLNDRRTVLLALVRLLLVLWACLARWTRMISRWAVLVMNRWIVLFRKRNRRSYRSLRPVYSRATRTLAKVT